jgi:hypothetical protein
MNHSTAGTYAGTDKLVTSLIEESKHAHGWRPLRAGILYAQRETAQRNSDADVIYMTGEQFTSWVAEAKALAKARGDGLKPSDVLGVSTLVIKGMKDRGVTSKPIALACAHYSVGLPMPIEAGSSRALDDWYRPRFGGTERVAEWLQIAAKTLSNRLRGFELRGGDVRVDREPEAYWVRALDWIHTVGPFCPFGPKPAVDIWPGQTAELNPDVPL